MKLRKSLIFLFTAFMFVAVLRIKSTVSYKRIVTQKTFWTWGEIKKLFTIKEERTIYSEESARKYSNTTHNGWQKEHIGEDVSQETKPRDKGKMCAHRRTKVISAAETEKRKRDELVIPETYNAGCPKRFAVTTVSNLRTGNWMSEYVHIIGFCQRYDCDPYLPDHIHKVLKDWFPNMRVPALKNIEHCGTTFIEKDYRDITKSLLETPDEAKQNNYILFQLIQGYVDYGNYYEKLKDDFTLQKDIKELAEDVIYKIKEKYHTENIIGVHVRRSNYISFLKRKTNGYFLGNSYYQRGFAFFKSRFPDAVFVIVSTDIPWCKRYLNSKKYTMVYPGTANKSSPMFDFALLASCTHSVYGLGTFGYWASFLAGGLVTYPINFSGDEGCDTTLPMIETQNLPTWYPLLGADD